jgi:hypothetical protein
MRDQCRGYDTIGRGMCGSVETGTIRWRSLQSGRWRRMRMTFEGCDGLCDTVPGRRDNMYGKTCVAMNVIAKNKDNSKVLASVDGAMPGPR